MAETDTDADDHRDVRALAVAKLGAASLMTNGVTTALAIKEGVDLGLLRLPYSQRPRCISDLPVEYTPRLLDWNGKASSGFRDPIAARHFFESYELYPGLVVRDWDHPMGRLGFGLNGEEVIFDLHLPDAGLLIRGSANMVTIALSDQLPETVCVAMIGKPLESLVAWPPASGPDHIIVSVEVGDGVQVVKVATTPRMFHGTDGYFQYSK